MLKDKLLLISSLAKIAFIDYQKGRIVVALNANYLKKKWNLKEISGKLIAL